MESNKNISNEPGKTSINAGTGQTSSPSTGSMSGQVSRAAASATQTARDVGSNIASGAQQAYDQTKQVVSNAYDKTSEVLGNTYDQAMTYGRQNPGTLTLIAFGAGVGIGLLLAGSFSGRSRTRRIAEPVVNALSEIALEFLR